MKKFEALNKHLAECWTAPMITEIESRELKKVMNEQKERRAAARQQQAEESKALKEIMEQQQARRKKILGR